MKKINFLVLILLTMVLTLSCENEKNVKSQLSKLREQRTRLRDENYSLLEKTDSLKMVSQNITEHLKELNILKSGRQPLYIIKFKLKQSHYSLDIGKHMKDAMNAIEFEMSVGKEYFDKVNVGDNVINKFRTGSMVLYGSFGSWKMKVVSKDIR